MLYFRNKAIQVPPNSGSQKHSQQARGTKLTGFILYILRTARYASGKERRFSLEGLGTELGHPTPYICELLLPYMCELCLFAYASFHCFACATRGGTRGLAGAMAPQKFCKPLFKAILAPPSYGDSLMDRPSLNYQLINLVFYSKNVTKSRDFGGERLE